MNFGQAGNFLVTGNQTGIVKIRLGNLALETARKWIFLTGFINRAESVPFLPTKNRLIYVTFEGCWLGICPSCPTGWILSPDEETEPPIFLPPDCSRVSLVLKHLAQAMYIRIEGDLPDQVVYFQTTAALKGEVMVRPVFCLMQSALPLSIQF